jgi:uncharacterized membrane protein
MPKGFWWIVEIAALCAFLAIPALTLICYDALPATIPIHFGPSGTPDGYGSKATLIFLVVIDTIVFVVLSTTPFFPNSINMPGPRTAESIQAGIAMTRILKLEVMLFMVYVTRMIIQTAHGNANGLGGIVPLLFVFALVSTIGAGFYTSTRNAN